MAVPIAIPIGVVRAKKHAIIVVCRVRNWACEMQPPSAKPSKNWWNDNAPIKGLMVHGLCETPRESPIMIECDTIPSSKTYKKDVKVTQNISINNNINSTKE